MNKIDLLYNLKMRIERCVHTVDHNFKDLPYLQLTNHPDMNKWSILACIEHLNLYGDHYIPAISTSISKSYHKASINTLNFRPTWLGNIFCDMMEDKMSIRTSMRTFKKMDPNFAGIRSEALSVFEQQQSTYCQLIKEAENLDLNDIMIPLSVSRWLKLNLGDTLRFLVSHQERHLSQALQILRQINSPAT